MTRNERSFLGGGGGGGGTVTTPNASDVALDPTGLTVVTGLNVQDAVAELDAAASGEAFIPVDAVMGGSETGSPPNGLLTTDGYTLVAGNRVLVMGGSVGAIGIWNAAAGNWTRSADCLTAGDVPSGKLVWVRNKQNARGGRFFVVDNESGNAPGAGPIYFEDVTSAGSNGSAWNVGNAGAKLGYAFRNKGELIAATGTLIEGDIAGSTTKRPAIVTAPTADGQVLTSDTAENSGVKWAAPTAGGSVAWKDPVLVATTANLASLSGLTADGITLSDGDRVLVWRQNDTSQNGIYNAHSGAWTRAADLDASGDYLAGFHVAVQRGTFAQREFFAYAPNGAWTPDSSATGFDVGTPGAQGFGKGALIVGSIANGFGDFARLGVGADGQVLTADSTVDPQGMKWAAPSVKSAMWIPASDFDAYTTTLPDWRMINSQVPAWALLDGVTTGIVAVFYTPYTPMKVTLHLAKGDASSVGAFNIQAAMSDMATGDFTGADYVMSPQNYAAGSENATTLITKQLWASQGATPGPVWLRIARDGTDTYANDILILGALVEPA